MSTLHTIDLIMDGSMAVAKKALGLFTTEILTSTVLSWIVPGTHNPIHFIKISLSIRMQVVGPSNLFRLRQSHCPYLPQAVA